MKNPFLIVFLALFCAVFSPVFSSSKEKDEKASARKSSKAEETSAPASSMEVERIMSAPIFIPEKETQVPAKREKPKGGRISGRILDQKGNPITGVNVRCIDEKGTVVAQVISNADGNYLFEDIEKGEYTIQVDSSGFSHPIEIRFEGHSELPGSPAKLKVFEIHQDLPGGSYLYASWDKVPAVISYTCGLYAKGGDDPLIEYPDIQQNFCEFGNLEENTVYEIRVYSKNEIGYSKEFISKIVQTANKPPLPPFGLAVTHAKNNRVDLLWNSTPEYDLKGYVLQVKREKGEFLFYSREGFTPERDRAFVIPYTGNGLETHRISESVDNLPIMENSVPYSFRIFSLDESGSFSKPSAAVSGIVLEDTIPPSPPKNLQHEFIGENRIRISWETEERDVVNFVLYYGVDTNRWDGVISTKRTSYDLIIDREKLRDKELLVTIIAVDRAGNESGYKPFLKKTTVEKNEDVSEDIVLTEHNIYKDYSLAIKSPPLSLKKVTQRKREAPRPAQPRTYGFEVLKSRGYIVQKGETANLTGKMSIPKNIYIQVHSGGTLNIMDARITPAGEKWGGIRYLGGSAGIIQNTEIAGSTVALAIFNNENGVRLRNVEIIDSSEVGVQIKDSRVEISLLRVKNGTIGLFLENSRVSVSNSLFDGNEKGVLAKNYSLSIFDSQFLNNRVYGLRVYGGGRISRCAFRNNLAGVVLETGMGSSQLLDSAVELNRMDGIVVSTSNTEIKGNLITNNGRHGIYMKEGSNPEIVKNDLIDNSDYAAVGGGKVVNCYVAYNNGSTYIDDTGEKGRPDNVFSSSSSGIIKQILNVDYINQLAMTSVLR